MILSSTTRKQGQRGCRPFPCTPNPRRAASASLRTISLDDSEHLLHNHHVSVAALRLLFTFAPECRSASLRNRCSLSPEYPHKPATRSMVKILSIVLWRKTSRISESNRIPMELSCAASPLRTSTRAVRARLGHSLPARSAIANRGSQPSCCRSDINSGISGLAALSVPSLGVSHSASCLVIFEDSTE